MARLIPLDEIRAMQTLAQEVFRVNPAVVDMTMGELAYQGALGSTDASVNSIYRIWRDGSDVLAWAVVWPPGTLEWQVNPERPELLDDVIDWFESAADSSADLEIKARDSDPDAQRRIQGRGFSPDPAAPFMRMNMRDLDEIEAPKLPTGYRLHTLSDYGGDIAGRVAVHRASWAELGTRVTDETYPVVMATWPYRSDLDFMVEDPEGRPVAFALGWYDEANKVGEFEPVGTVPAVRRLGLGRAVNLFGLHRFRATGATRAIVACRGDAGYPAPCRLYESIGFREISRQRKYVRRAVG
jgi:GNAT superfamily N-acetyltransferase